VVTALLLPFLTLLTVTRAEAQIQTLPTWAVVDFVNRSPGGKGGEKIGALAADAIANELSKTGKYDVTPREQVARAIQQLNLVAPVTEATSLYRLAQELQATALVTGDVINWQVRPEGNGKQADVIVRCVVRDVASGLPVNGSAQSASSSVRPGDTPDEVLLQEAFSLVATKIVNEISTRSLPRGTVLNTFENSAFVNQGTRSGFKPNQKLIVFRGKEQVATGVVTEATFDSSTLRIERSYKGVRPGDKVQVVFAVSDIDASFGNRGEVRTITARKARRPNDFLVPLGAILILTAMMTGRGSSGQQVINRLRAEATFDNLASGPGVKVSFNTNQFVRGNQQKFQWQIWRNDVLNTPVLVAPGNASFVVDTAAGRAISWFTAPRNSVTVCTQAPTAEADVSPPGITPGVPYQYTVELIYRIDARDFPDPPTGAQFCYYQSDRQNTPGPATPLNRPDLNAPAQGVEIQEAVPFTVQSVVTANPIIVQYILQFSSSPQFTRGTTETLNPPVTSNSPSLISLGVIDTFNGRKGFIRNAKTVWWRVGARNIDDKPGPVPDASGERYIFSIPRSFTRPDNPPPPPGGGTGGNPPL
jgi:hypothetical protein